MLAIQRLVRGDDGLTKIIYIDLQTLQQIDDLTGYRIVNSGTLEPEPVASVETPDEPSRIQPPVPTDGFDNDDNPTYGGGPISQAPNQNVAPTVPGQTTQPESIRTPERNVPDAVSPPASVEPEVESVPADLGPLGGIRTNQGSILPSLDYDRFSPPRAPAEAPTSMSGNQNPTDLERSLHSRNELENIKDESLGIGYKNPDRVKDDEEFAAPPRGIAMTPNANRVKDDAVTPNVASAPRGAVDAGIAGAGRVGNFRDANSLIDSGLQNMDDRRESLMSQKDRDLGPAPVGFTGRTKDDALADRAAEIAGVFGDRHGTSLRDIGSAVRSTSFMARPDVDMASGIPTEGLSGAARSVAGKVGPTYAGNPNRTKDDFAGVPGTTQTHSVFDSPNKSTAEKVKDAAMESARTPASKTDRLGSTRTTGFASAMNNPNQNKTTSFMDSAGYSQVDRTGTRGWRNNNPGNLEASKWTQSQPGYLGTDNRFAIFDTVENGIKAQASLLGTKNYANKTIAGAIAVYAPAFENNTVAYAQHVADAVGVPVSTKMSDLTSAQRESMVAAMHEVEGSTRVGTSTTSLTAKGIAARDHYTGFGTGSDSPSETNAANRPASGGVAGSGRAGAGFGGHSTSPGSFGSYSSPGIGRSSIGTGSSGGSSGYGTGGGSGKSASSTPGNSVSGASRSTSGKGGASPSASSGGQSGAAQSGTSGKTGTKSGSHGNNSGTSVGNNPGMADKEKS